MSDARRPVRKDVLRNRARLIESADALIREHGMELSLNAVAHHAGVGVGTVYRHFADRDELLHALLEQRVNQVETLMTAHLDDDDPVAAFRDTVFEICEMQAEDRGVWEVLSSGAREDHHSTIRARLVPLADTLIGRAAATGRMRAGLASTDLPILLWTGGALTAYLGPVSRTAWRRYIQIMLDGLLADPGSGRVQLEHAPLTVDGIDAAMQAWRPGGIQRD